MNQKRKMWRDILPCKERKTRNEENENEFSILNRIINNNKHKLSYMLYSSWIIMYIVRVVS